MKLSLSQKLTLKKLTSEWQTIYQIDERANTLDSLVKMGLAIKKIEIDSKVFPKRKSYYKKGGERE